MLIPLALLALAAAPKCSAWLVFYDDGSSLASFAAHANQLSSVSAGWLRCTTGGALVRESGATPELGAKALAIAHANRVKVYGLVANQDFNPAIVEAFLGKPVQERAHIQALVNYVVEDGLDGLDLDYESLKAADRDNFSTFVEDLGAALHQRHKSLAIALHPKTSEPGNWDGPEAQDWSRIGKAVDFARIMCYDEHWTTSEAGPVADLSWVKSIMAFAVTQIPRTKLDIGVPAYGYDWLGKQGSDVDWKQFQALPGASKATRDPVSQELTLKHDGRTVFFSDAVSEIPKVDLAASLGVHGVTMWRLGLEDPSWWTKLRNRRAK